jgi:NAD(P) transhydrogenase subunit alpha
MNLMFDTESGQLKIDREDEIIAGTLICTGGEVIGKP